MARTPQHAAALPGHLRLTEDGVDRRAQWLDESVFSRSMQWQQIETLAAYWQACRAPAGCTIFPEGWRTPFMAVVASGRVRAEKLDSAGTTRTLAEFGPGKIFGEMALVDGEPTSARAVAASDTVLLVLTAHRFEQLRAEQPGVALAMMMTLARLISQKLRATSGKLVDLL